MSLHWYALGMQEEAQLKLLTELTHRLIAVEESIEAVNNKISHLLSARGGN